MTEEEFIKRIGKRVEVERLKLEWSREEMAKIANVNRMQIYRIETGKHATSIVILRRIAQGLNISITELVDVE